MPDKQVELVVFGFWWIWCSILGQSKFQICQNFWIWPDSVAASFPSDLFWIHELYVVCPALTMLSIWLMFLLGDTFMKPFFFLFPILQQDMEVSPNELMNILNKIISKRECSDFLVMFDITCCDYFLTISLQTDSLCSKKNLSSVSIAFWAETEMSRLALWFQLVSTAVFHTC